MKIKFISLLAIMSLSCLSSFAYADVTIVNNTDTNATAEIIYLPLCTGPNPDGVIQKKSFKTLPTEMLNNLCKKHETACAGLIYMSDDCSGTAIAKVTLDLSKNSVSVENFGIDGYTAKATGNTITIEK